MKTAFLFDGQGSQYAGMGGDIYNYSSETIEMCAKVSRAAGIDVIEMALNGSHEEIKNSRNAQVCLYALEMCIAQILVKAGIEPDIAAGFSFGEYPAIVAAGGMSFEEGIEVVNARGTLMAESASRKKGAMALVCGVPEEELRHETARLANIHIACFDAATEHFLAGERDVLELLVKAQRAKGIEAIMLPVGGAFHSPFIEDASILFRDVLKKVAFRDPRIPVVGNTAASVITTAAGILDDTLKQMLSPVQWYATILTMMKSGVTRFIEIGPGHGLKRMVLKTWPEASIFTTRNMNEIKEIISLE